MLRQLLTLLAVLTGLTATVAPAHALDSSVQAVEMAQDAAGSMAQVEAARIGLAEPAMQTSEVRQGLKPGPMIALVVPTVMLQADRARE